MGLGLKNLFSLIKTDKNSFVAFEFCNIWKVICSVRANNHSPVIFPKTSKVVLTLRPWILLFSFIHQKYVNSHELEWFQDRAVMEESVSAHSFLPEAESGSWTAHRGSSSDGNL